MKILVSERCRTAKPTLTQAKLLNADDNDITSAVGNLSWQNSIDELATTMTFDVAKTDAEYINIYTPQLGSIIRFFTNTEIFRGIVITIDDGNRGSNKYTVVDFGWYLNKSKETYQFTEMPAYKAITKICSDFDIDIDTIANLNTPISRIYFDKTISDIIKDILSICGGNYNLDMTPNGIRIYEIGSIYAYPEFKVSNNMRLIYSPNYKGNVSHQVSIDDMKNSVKTISESDGAYTELVTVQDSDLISQYGLLQEVVTVDVENKDATAAANIKLDELAVIKETFDCEIIELVDSYTRAGSVLEIDSVNYVIESSQHSIKSGVHYVKLGLRQI